MKRFLILSIMSFLAVQIIYFICKSPHITESENEYKKAMSVLEGLRGKDADFKIQAMQGTLSKEVYEKLRYQQSLMNDIERRLHTLNMDELEDKPGYVAVGGEFDMYDVVAVPLFVYQTGYHYLLGETDSYFHYINATLTIIFMLFFFLMIQRNCKMPINFPVWCQLLIAICIAIITTLPLLVWVIWNYGFSGAEYSVLSVVDIGGGTIAGMVRILFIMKIFGILMLESLFIFLNRYFYNKPFRVASIVAGLSILPIWIIYIWDKAVVIGTVGNLIVGIDAIRYSYEYVGGLCLLAIAAIAVCKYLPVYHYSEEEINKMMKHFHDV